MNAIEIQNSNVRAVDVLNIDNWIISGIYLNTDENNNKSYYYVDTDNKMVMFLTSYDLAPSFLKDTKDATTGISEDFALKMLSIATKNEKYKEL